jgi:hypothetical protein
VWKKLSQHPEFADVLPGASTAPTPIAVAPPPMIPPVPAESCGATDSASAVTGPAIALIVVAVMDLLMAVMSVLGGVLGWGMGAAGAGMHFRPHGMDPEIQELIGWLAGPVGLVGNFLSLIINGVILVGAVRMMSLRSYGLCMVAALLAIIPCTAPCCCLGIAAGVWALVVLTRPEIKQAFH